MLKILFLFATLKAAFCIDAAMYKNLISFRECLSNKYIGLCLKEKALRVLDETMLSDKPISFYNMVDVEKNPSYFFNTSAENGTFPDDMDARSIKLNTVLQDKVEEFFRSRVFKFNMAPTFEEGRAKKGGKGGGKGNMMMMMGVGAMGCMMMQMYLGKVAFLAGTALILAKVALFLSAIMGLKKLSGGGGGGGGGETTAHVVYATEGHSHGGGGGGWHRSIEGDVQNVVYKAHNQDYGY